jgi:hypothetical protein
MPSSILSRFKKSPAHSNKLDLGSDDNLTPDRPTNRRSTSPHPERSFDSSAGDSPTSHLGNENGTGSGSHFVEEFDRGAITPDTRARGFTLPPLGTPKLTLTEDGASSPISFGSSPQSQGRASHIELRKRPSHERLGLGIGPVEEVSPAG